MRKIETERERENAKSRDRKKLLFFCFQLMKYYRFDLVIICMLSMHTKQYKITKYKTKQIINQIKCRSLQSQLRQSYSIILLNNICQILSCSLYFFPKENMATYIFWLVYSHFDVENSIINLCNLLYGIEQNRIDEPSMIKNFQRLPKYG